MNGITSKLRTAVGCFHLDAGRRMHYKHLIDVIAQLICCSTARFDSLAFEHICAYNCVISAEVATAAAWIARASVSYALCTLHCAQAYISTLCVDNYTCCADENPTALAMFSVWRDQRRSVSAACLFTHISGVCVHWQKKTQEHNISPARSCRDMRACLHMCVFDRQHIS